MPTAPLLAIALALSQSSVSILDRAIDCVAPGDHPVVKAAIDPGVEVRSAKVYFRSEKYPKFYFVAMSPEAGTFTSVLPRPSAETTRIIYYIEAVDTTFASVVGPEHVLDVRSDCVHSDADAPNVADAPPPQIVVGTVEAGAAALPPGFETAGIIGTLASTGILTGLGGGSGIGTAAVVGGIAAAGAGGAVVAATASGGGETSPPEATEPPAPAPSTPSPSPSSPSPPPDSPPSPTPPPTPPSPSPAPTPTPPAPATVQACFTASFPGKSCNLKLDAGCSTGSIVSWNWVVDAPESLGGTSTHSGQSVNRNFPQCSGETIRVSLTVSNAAGDQNSTARDLKLPVMLEPSIAAPPRCTIASLLTPPDWQGNVVLDAIQAEAVRGAIPSSHRPPLTASEHEVEAYLVSVAGQGEGLWTFDLSHCPSLTPGSLTPVRGMPVVRDGARISFRVAGAPGERIQFRFRLSR